MIAQQSATRQRQWMCSKHNYFLKRSYRLECGSWQQKFKSLKENGLEKIIQKGEVSWRLHLQSNGNHSWSPSSRAEYKDGGKLVTLIKTQSVSFFCLFFFITTGVILTVTSIHIILFIKSFMYGFHAVFKRSEMPSPVQNVTTFLIHTVK